ncbi:hypothetical protein SAMN05414139_08374 [Burkholderia sp. D7]|nr:hypothetical protein SAMN05414139_08374 [Burkholderia sp. D7]
MTGTRNRVPRCSTGVTTQEAFDDRSEIRRAFLHWIVSAVWYGHQSGIRMPGEKCLLHRFLAKPRIFLADDYKVRRFKPPNVVDKVPA